MQSNIRSMRLRASSYNIYVDLPGQDEMLLVHGYLGSYDRVSRRVTTYLHSLDPKPPKPLYGDWTPETVDTDEIVVPSPSTIDALKRRGYLTEKTVDEEEAYFSEVATKLHNLSSLRKTSYIFMPTYNLIATFAASTASRTICGPSRNLSTCSIPCSQRW